LTEPGRPDTSTVMTARAETIDLAGQGMDHSPLVRSWTVQVTPPSLRDNIGLADRLTRAVEKETGLTGLTAPLSLTAGLADLYAKADYRVWAAVQVDRNPGRIVMLEPAPGPGQAYGLAVDLGSTTLVFALVDLEAPGVIDQLTLANPQVRYGEDILSRVHFADRPGGLDTLVQALRRAVNQGAAEICSAHGLDPRGLVAAALAGNTTMTHFILGLSPRTIIREPYVPVINRPEGLTAAQIGLDLAPEAPVLIMPNKGAYFGGDLMAGLVVSGMNRAEKPCFLVDVGTNAEVVVGQADWLLGAAGAAGPALEGGVAQRGMAASPGAVDLVRIDRASKTLTYRTIDGQPPRGLCGSGLIDLLAELFLSGLIDFRGKLTLPPGHPLRRETDEGPAFIVVPADETQDGRPITVSEIDLDILIRSKAAMYTILTTVIKSVGLTFGQIDRFYVAGTFGRFIDPRLAVAVGMLPDLPLERYVPLGNSSLQGAILALVSGQARAEVLEVWRKLTYLEMNVNQELMNRFSAARFMPHTNRSLFPSVGTIIN